MTRRELDFRDFGAVVAEVDRLAAGGYDRAGRWDLSQVCKHLAHTLRGTLEGFGFRLPWPIPNLIGRPLMRKVLRDRRMRSGVPSPPRLVPGPAADPSAAVAEFKGLIDRFETAAEGDLHPSPLFGRMTREQWRDLHLIHSAHHLGFLIPRGS